MSATLSKKKQKALLFRQQAKAKKTGEAVPGDVPEEDAPEDDVEADAVVIQPAKEKNGESSTAQSNKRKRAAEDDNAKPAQDLTGGIKGKVKDVGKGKGKAWDDAGGVEGEGGKAGKRSKKEIKQRFILFIGNIGFKTTVPEVQTHFKEAVGHYPQVRLLTTKPDNPKQQPKSRGIAFLELPTSTDLQAALKLHHTQLNGRRINVELTAGGGGKSEERSKKVKERNERVGVQRVRKEEKEREAAVAAGETGAGVAGTAVTPVQGKPGAGEAREAAQPASAEVSQSQGGNTEYQDGFKIRGGRRVKVQGKPDAGRPGGAQNSRWGGAPAGRNVQPQRGGRRWEPTGANALTVG